MKKRFVLLTLTMTTLLLLVACKQTDVVGSASITSFEEILKAIPDQITADEENGGWSLISPDGTARFVWSKDFSNNATYDAMIEFNAKPFIDAGLDVSKLPEGSINNDKIQVGTDFGNKSITYKGDATPIDSYKKIVELKRDSISYHTALGHYGISLENGNVFEWAKDMDENDKDIVFVLNPQMFLDAGVDPNKVEGWVFAKVEVMDKDGKKVEVDKLLKPFELN